MTVTFFSPNSDIYSDPRSRSRSALGVKSEQKAFISVDRTSAPPLQSEAQELPSSYSRSKRADVEKEGKATRKEEANQNRGLRGKTSAGRLNVWESISHCLKTEANLPPTKEPQNLYQISSFYAAGSANYQSLGSVKAGTPFLLSFLFLRAF